jgi:hypothetical protein
MKSTVTDEDSEDEGYLDITLPPVIINIGVRSIVLCRLIEGLERFDWVALFHMHAGDLDPALGQGRCQPYRLFKVGLGAIGLSNQETITRLS